MRTKTVYAVAAAVVLGGCAPYVYKSEINAFAGGVDDLATAYRTGMKGMAGDRVELQRWQWSVDRPRVSLSEECVVDFKSPAAGPACAVLPSSGKPLPPSAVETQAAAAAPIVAALRDYANALAAVTNAEDAEQLDAAQTKFRGSLQGLLKQQSVEAPKVGPVVELIGAAFTAVLNERRYTILRDGVTAANGAVEQLGQALGETLTIMRVAQAGQLKLTADHMALQLGPGVGGREYVERLSLVEAKAASLESLRRSDPRRAADDMVRAHRELARALADESRQGEAVFEAVIVFSEKAKAVRSAFGRESKND